jgi:hypothetical protein
MVVVACAIADGCGGSSGAKQSTDGADVDARADARIDGGLADAVTTDTASRPDADADAAAADVATDRADATAADAVAADRAVDVWDGMASETRAADAGAADANVPDLAPTPSCRDQIKDQDETDIDCGGSCAPCWSGAACRVAADCASHSCSASVCLDPRCDDGILNGDESDVDCGGSCGACPVGAGCHVGADCTQRSCSSGICAEHTCSDGVQNGTETGPDCGGGDCGSCSAGGGCRVAGDCATHVCKDDACVPATCADGVQNGGETDVDCGGGTCPSCVSGGHCRAAGDCTSKVCASGGTCAVPTCSDGIENGAETGVDCGAACAHPCPAGGGCNADGDCATGSCFFGRCQRPGFRLEAARAFESGLGPVEAATGDLDGDGRPDVVGLNRSGNSISVLHSAGDGSLGLVAQYPIGIGQEPVQAVVTDLDGDGDRDVVVRTLEGAMGRGTTGTLAIFLNSGDGTLTAGAELVVPAVVVRVADLDGDGTPDLVVADPQQGVGWLRGRGAGAYDDVAWGLAGPSSFLEVGDFSGTGHMDLLVQTDPQTPFDAGTLLFPNQGGATFGPPHDVPPRASPNSLLTTGFPLGVADLDGDGLLDVLAGCPDIPGPLDEPPMPGQCGLNVLSGDGKGQFVARLGEIEGLHFQLEDPVIADMDGDGDNDFVVRTIVGTYWNATPQVQIWSNDGTGRFSVSKSYGSSTGFAFGPWVADLDGKNGNDVVVGHGGRRIDPTDVTSYASTGANLRVLLNDGGGNLGAATVIQGDPATSLTNCVTVGDLDGDGDDDIAIGAETDPALGTYYVKVFIMEAGRIIASTQTPVANEPLGIAAGDFDGDGDDDLAVVGSDTVTVLLSSGRGLFAGAYQISVPSVYAARAGDLDGDGLDDLVLGRDSGVSWLLAGKNGVFGPLNEVAVPGVIEQVALGDVNGDGALDIVATDHGPYDPSRGINMPGNVTVLENDGYGLFAPSGTFQTGDHPTASTFGDLDGDGHGDFAVTNGLRNDVTIFRGQGTTFTVLGTYPVLVNPSDIATGDFNGDGRPDLAVATFSSSAVSILLNRGGGQFERVDYEGGYNSIAIAIGDVDRSGTPDVVVIGDTGTAILLNATASAVKVCAAGQPACDHATATTCNAAGTGYTGARTVCAASQSCVAGACLPDVCSPRTTSCDAQGNLVRCAADGQSTRVIDACGSNEYCTPGYIACRAQVCTPNAPYCDQNRAGTCNGDGSALAAGGQLCNGYNQACSGGACLALAACTPGTWVCIGGNVWGCQSDGQSRYIGDNCGTGTHCEDGARFCVADACAKGQPACVGDVLRTCNAAGTFFAPAPQIDCVATGQICVGNACTDSETLSLADSGGFTTNRPGGFLLASVFRVDTSRTLRDFAYQFSVPAARAVTWSVFQSPTGVGSFVKIFEKTTSVAPGDGFDYHSSGPIDILLVGGFQYALGYYVPDGHDAAYAPTGLDATTSFGAALGAVGKSFDASSLEVPVGPFPIGAISMRVTTASP